MTLALASYREWHERALSWREGLELAMKACMDLPGASPYFVDAEFVRLVLDSDLGDFMWDGKRLPSASGVIVLAVPIEAIQGIDEVIGSDGWSVRILSFEWAYSQQGARTIVTPDLLWVDDASHSLMTNQYPSPLILPDGRMASGVSHAVLEQADDEEAGARSVAIDKFMQMIMLAGQPIVKRSTGTIDRAARRRIGSTRSEGTVIHLRRHLYQRQGHSDGDSAIEYMRRWWVRGHAREQYYPSENTHRTIWIDPYIKGPDDKPLSDYRVPQFVIDR